MAIDGNGGDHFRHVTSSVETQAVQVAQATTTATDATVAQVIPVEPGARIELPEVDLASATLALSGNDLQITQADGSVIVLRDFVTAAQSDTPPELVFADSLELSSGDMLAAAVAQTAPAAGPAAGPAGAVGDDDGTIVTPEPQGPIGQGFDITGPLGPTALSFGFPEPEINVVPTTEEVILPEPTPTPEPTPAQLVINEIGVFGGEAAQDTNFIELFNDTAAGQSTAGNTITTVGPGGAPVTFELPATTVPSGGYLVLHQNGDYQVYGAGSGSEPGSLLEQGTFTTAAWGWGSDTTEALGADLSFGGTSTDSFLANGAAIAGAVWNGAGASSASPVAQSIADAVGGAAPAMVDNATFNGHVGDIDAILADFGATRPMVNFSGYEGSVEHPNESPSIDQNHIFARNVGDSDSEADWTTTDAGTAGGGNDAASINPQDNHVSNPSPDDFDPKQSTNPPADAGQTVTVATGAEEGVVGGGRGPDFMYGSTNSDQLAGGDHNDFLFGDAGNDLLSGGVIESLGSADLLIGAAGGADVLFDVNYYTTKTGFDGGEPYSYDVFVDAGQDMLVGGNGEDLLVTAGVEQPEVATFAVTAQQASGFDGDLLVGDSIAYMTESGSSQDFNFSFNSKNNYTDGNVSPQAYDFNPDLGRPIDVAHAPTPTDGIGVGGDSRGLFDRAVNEINYDPNSGQTETLVFRFGDVELSEGHFEVSKFYHEKLKDGTSGDETGSWQAYYHGGLVDGGTFDATGSSGGNLEVNFSLTYGKVFDELRFVADPYSNIAGGGGGVRTDSSDYYVKSLDVHGSRDTLHFDLDSPVDNDVVFAGDSSDMIFGDNMGLSEPLNSFLKIGDIEGIHDLTPLYGAVEDWVINQTDDNLVDHWVSALNADGSQYDSAGDDNISAGGGNDLVFGQGGDDEILGGDGDDIIFGGDGNDLIDGGFGEDTISGGIGADTIAGGSGNDTYVYDSILEAGDVILGTFSEEVNIDMVDLDGLLDQLNVADADRGSRVEVVQDGTDVTMTIDVDGDGLFNDGAGAVLLATFINASEFNVDDSINYGVL